MNLSEKAVLKAFEEEYHHSYNDDEFSATDRALLLLCGSQSLYSDTSVSQRIELVRSKPSLELKKSQDGFYHIKLSHDFGGILLWKIKRLIEHIG